MTISEAKKAMLDDGTEASAQAFSAAFADAVAMKTQVNVPVHKVEGGWSVELNSHCGELFAVIFSDRDKALVRPVDGRLISADINSVIDTVYKNPRLAGIAVDPQSEPVYISRKQIDALTVRHDPRLQERDWGEGIPKSYRQSDLLCIEELTDLAMDIVTQYAANHGYAIFERYSSPVYIPNLILEKDGVTYYVAVEAGLAPDIPRLRPDKLKALQDYALALNAKCLYAPVGLGSSDKERFAERLALCGDRYIVNFGGFENV